MSYRESAVRYDEVHRAPQYDTGPGKHRIGLITLSNDYVMERDFMNMRMQMPSSDDLAIFTSRLLNTPDCTVETLRAMAPQISRAAALLIPEGRLDVVAYGCTSGTAVLGYDKVCSLIQSVRPGVQCVTPLTSSLAALECFGAKRIAVLTPYIDEVNQKIADYIEAAGKSISTFSSFKITDNEQMANLSPESIFQAAIDMDCTDADALFISCTAIRAVDVIESIEQTLGKPVITAIQAMFWQSLRLSGCHQPVSGYGRLLKDW